MERFLHWNGDSWQRDSLMAVSAAVIWPWVLASQDIGQRFLIYWMSMGKEKSARGWEWGWGGWQLPTDKAPVEIPKCWVFCFVLFCFSWGRFSKTFPGIQKNSFLLWSFYVFCRKCLWCSFGKNNSKKGRACFSLATYWMVLWVWEVHSGTLTTALVGTVIGQSWNHPLYLSSKRLALLSSMAITELSLVQF